MALNNLGCVQTLRGDLGAARSLLAEALSLSHRMGNRRRQAFTLAAIATLAAVAGQPERAVRLDAVASAAVAQIGASLVQPAYALGIPHLDRARRMLGPAAVAEATATGSAMTLAQAVEETLAWLAEPESFAQIRSRLAGGASSPPFHEAPPRRLNAPPVLAVVPSPRGVGLSPRELEVAALVARGMTNRQIAAELAITEGTAANHVKHILARLVLDSRVQIATWAIERGLHRRPHPDGPSRSPPGRAISPCIPRRQVWVTAGSPVVRVPHRERERAGPRAPRSGSLTLAVRKSQRIPENVACLSTGVLPGVPDVATRRRE